MSITPLNPVYDTSISYLSGKATSKSKGYEAISIKSDKF